ncbi:MAG TPA: response regulator [Steroidobacteraceae bacterium]|nr:response regulator [Steroidobacteraceae bacterium]
MTDAMFLVLIVEDDAGIRSVLRTLLESQHYRVVEAETGGRGAIEARTHRPDLAIIDLGLPDRDGLSLIREIRRFSPLPILVLSARTMETDKIAALDAGADDYVAKPFSAPEMLARVRAALRRSARGGEQLPLLRLGAVTVDLTKRSARGADGPVHLTPLEFRVIECLARNAGVIVTQAQLIREAWGPDRLGDSRGLRSYVKMLRQKLEPDPRQPRYLITEAGIGYRLQPDELEGANP